MLLYNIKLKVFICNLLREKNFEIHIYYLNIFYKEKYKVNKYLFFYYK